MKIKITDLKNKIQHILASNFGESNASLITEYLIWAEMIGCKTQGILKMGGTSPLQKIIPLHPIKVERETKLSAILNAGRNPAPLASQIATDTLIKIVKQNGFGLVGVNNVFSSNGALAFYVNKIAEAGFIGFMCSRSPSSTTAFDSIDALFGTNPIGISIPTSEEPLVFDMATSAFTYYGLILANLKGEKLPENVAIDSDGNITNDPKKALDGAILPFDRSYKGSALGMFVELLAGPLVGAGWVDNKTYDQSWGTLVLGIDPELLVDRAQFKLNATDLINKIKSSRKKAGCDEIRIPGERARQAYKEAERSGYLEIDEAVLREAGII